MGKSPDEVVKSADEVVERMAGAAHALQRACAAHLGGKVNIQLNFREFKELYVAYSQSSYFRGDATYPLDKVTILGATFSREGDSLRGAADAAQKMSMAMAMTGVEANKMIQGFAPLLETERMAQMNKDIADRLKKLMK